MICNNCNSSIPDDSEFCQCCGVKIEKQIEDDNIQERVKKSKILTIIMGISAVVGIGFGVAMLCLFLNVKNELNAQVADLNIKIEENEKTIKTDAIKYDHLEQRYDSLKEDYNYCLSYCDKASFMDQHIVFVGADGGKYHKYDCPFLDMSVFWAYNTEAVQGIHPACEYCN